MTKKKFSNKIAKTAAKYSDNSTPFLQLCCLLCDLGIFDIHIARPLQTIPANSIKVSIPGEMHLSFYLTPKRKV